MGGADARHRGSRGAGSRGATTVEYALLIAAVAGVLTFVARDEVGSTLQESLDSFIHAFSANLGSDGRPAPGPAPADLPIHAPDQVPSGSLPQTPVVSPSATPSATTITATPGG